MIDSKNPETIEIHGYSTIHKLCKFAADRDMEGCTFTDIVDRALNEINALKAQLAKLDDRWINVQLEEPPLDETVLICWSDSPDVEPEKDYITVDEDLNHYWANFHEDNPSHWMPLPKPPVKEAEGG